MINRPNNWNEVQEFAERPKLPVGAYVCRIKRAVVQNNSYGDQLCLLFDIADGQYGGFYQKDFDGNRAEDKKWKGVLRLFLPREDGSEKDEWTKSALKGLFTAIENSNPGYTWNWDETTLAGKMVGVMYRNEEYDYKGKQGWSARPFRALSVSSVRDNKYELPNPKPLNPSAVKPAEFTELSEDDGELPF